MFMAALLKRRLQIAVEDNLRGEFTESIPITSVEVELVNTSSVFWKGSSTGGGNSCWWMQRGED